MRVPESNAKYGGCPCEIWGRLGSAAIRSSRVTQGRVISSEWTKLRTLRSTRWSLLAGVVAMAGLGPLIAVAQMSRWAHLDPQERLTYDSINTGVGGYHLAQLAIARA